MTLLTSSTNHFLKINNVDYFKVNNQTSNGRVIDIDTKVRKSYPLFEQQSNNKNSFKCNALNGVQEKSKLSLQFFSNENFTNLQNLLRYNVYIKSNNKYKIGYQSDLDLKVIMRSIYLQHSPNLKMYIDKQVHYLNTMVVDWASPKIINEIDQYIGYIQSINKLPVPLHHPQNLSSAGTKVLKSVTSTF